MAVNVVIGKRELTMAEEKTLTLARFTKTARRNEACDCGDALGQSGATITGGGFLDMACRWA